MDSVTFGQRLRVNAKLQSGGFDPLMKLSFIKRFTVLNVFLEHTGIGIKGIKSYVVPVEIVEEGQEVESQFAPAFFLTERQDVGVHDGRRVVESWTAHHRSAHIPAAQFKNRLSVKFYSA